MTLSVVILAAGQGKRMKSDLPKVLQPLAGRPLLKHVIDCARSLDTAAVHVVSESAFGRLLGLDRPVLAPKVHGSDEALVIEATIDGMALARGVHDALDAAVGDIMSGRGR